jgi:hypothetical protein
MLYFSCVTFDLSQRGSQRGSKDPSLSDGICAQAFLGLTGNEVRPSLLCKNDGESLESRSLFVQDKIIQSFFNVGLPHWHTVLSYTVERCIDRRIRA